MLKTAAMRRITAASISLILLACLFLPNSLMWNDGDVLAAPDYSKLPEVTAPTAILVEANTGHIIFEQNMNRHMNPASTTMMMTALVVLENMDISDVVVSNGKAVKKIKDTVNLKKDEEMTVNDLLYAMLLTSSNEAAMTLALAVDDSEEKFVARMNKKAEELGMKDTFYTNVTGIDDEEHYTSPYDLATLSRAAMKNENFRGIVGTATYSIKKTNKNTKREIKNNNALFHNSDKEIRVYGEYRKLKFEETIGIIKGESKDGGSCIVASAERNDFELIAVVLGAKDSYVYNDAVEVFEYGFNNYECVDAFSDEQKLAEIKVKEGKKKTIKAIPSSQITAVMPVNSTAENLTFDVKPVKTVTAPVKSGDKLGTVTVLYDGVEVGTTDMIAANSIEVAKLAKFFSTSGKVFSFVIKLIIGIIIVLLLWGVYSVIKTERKKRGRQKKRFYGTDFESREIKRIKRLR